jgi:hypothetical protein
LSYTQAVPSCSASSGTVTFTATKQ